MKRKYWYTALALLLGLVVFVSFPKQGVNEFDMLKKAKEVVNIKPVIETKKNKNSIYVKKTNPVIIPKAMALINKKEIRKLTLDRSRTIFLTGEIGYSGVQAAMQLTELSNVSKAPIYILIDSPGGSIISGASLISAIQASPAPVYTICFRMCASMAAMIHQYGSRRYVLDRSLIMFHPASAATRGSLEEMHSFVRSILKYVSKIELEVAQRIGWSYKSYKQYTRDELWIDSDEAKLYNVADQIVFIRFKNESLLGLNEELEMQKKKYKKRKHKVKMDLDWIWKGNL